MSLFKSVIADARPTGPARANPPDAPLAGLTHDASPANGIASASAARGETGLADSRPAAVAYPGALQRLRRSDALGADNESDRAGVKADPIASGISTVSPARRPEPFIAVRRQGVLPSQEAALPIDGELTSSVIARDAGEAISLEQGADPQTSGPAESTAKSSPSLGIGSQAAPVHLPAVDAVEAMAPTISGVEPAGALEPFRREPKSPPAGAGEARAAGNGTPDRQADAPAEREDTVPRSSAIDHALDPLGYRAETEYREPDASPSGKYRDRQARDADSGPRNAALRFAESAAKRNWTAAVESARTQTTEPMPVPPAFPIELPARAESAAIDRAVKANHSDAAGGVEDDDIVTASTKPVLRPTGVETSPPGRDPSSAVIAPAPAVETAPRVRQSTTVVASEPNGASPPPAPAPAPSVRIGQVDVFVDRPPIPGRNRLASARLTPAFASRHYLRRP